MVEQRTFNPWVQGSSPWRPTSRLTLVGGLRPPSAQAAISIRGPSPRTPRFVAGVGWFNFCSEWATGHHLAAAARDRSALVLLDRLAVAGDEQD